MTLTVGSLFTGIGGIDLGLERAGMQVVWQAETDPYCSRVLAKHWPGVPNLGDVTTVDWSTVDRPDLIAGGYPCQPFSLAGQRAGEGDERHLWPHMARALRVLRPEWALLENVPGHLSLGFDTVQADLAALGYDTEWESIPATAVGAPHLRWRIFVVAYADGGRLTQQQERDGQPDRPGQQRAWRRNAQRLGDHVADTRRVSGEPGRDARVMGDTAGAGEGEASQRQRVRDAASSSGPILADTHDTGPQGTQPAERHNLPAGRGTALVDTPSVGRGNRPGVFGWVGPAKRDWWDVEPDVGRVAHGIPHRVDRLRALGNAVVPQVAEHVGRQIVGAAA